MEVPCVLFLKREKKSHFQKFRSGIAKLQSKNKRYLKFYVSAIFASSLAKSCRFFSIRSFCLGLGLECPCM